MRFSITCAVLIIAIVVTAAVGFNGSQSHDGRSEIDPVHGKWRMMGATQNGEPVQIYAQDAILTFRGGKVVIVSDKRGFTDQMTYTARTHLRPPQLDMENADPEFAKCICIFQVDGDKLRLASKDDGTRPISFAQKDVTIWSLVRVKSVATR